MKNIIKYSLAVLMLGFVHVTYGQVDPKDPITIDSKDYYQHGYNKDGGPGLPQEVRDSVTVTSTVKYFVLPDPAVSPEYKYDTPSNTVDFSKVNSTFAWSLINSRGTAAGTTPIVSVTWNTTGIDSLKVKETPKTGTCAGKETTIPVAVIAKPEIGFNPNGGLYSDGACYAQTQVTAGIDYPFAVTLTTQSSQVLVDYTVTKDGTDYSPLNGTDVPVSVTGGNITLHFTDYGKYVITVTKVTDRVSRKSEVEGVITPAGKQFEYDVMKPVQTGPIYRIPNNY
ncbi:MAG: hypothetical protein LBL04_05300 [Bacteroidales bacterium]|jgi:hypothetical protein|nr:hypothetical protein [Bacteroidales bacterium]